MKFGIICIKNEIISNDVKRHDIFLKALILHLEMYRIKKQRDASFI